MSHALSRSGAPPDDRPAAVTDEHDESRPASAITRLRARLATQLPVDATPLWNPRWAPWALVLSIAATAFLLRWRAAPGADDVIWAEDGSEFIQAELDHSTLTNVFRPYAGYVLVVPRLITAVVTEFPVAWWAAGMAFAAVAVRVACAAFVYRALAAHLSPTARLAIGIVSVTLPLAGLETLNNVANAQWFMIPAAAAALLWRPQRMSGQLLAALVVLAAAVTSPITVVLLPLAIWRVAVVGSWREHGVTAALAIGAAIQMAAVFSAQGRNGPSSDPVSAVWSWLYRVVASWPLGTDWAQDVLDGDRLGGFGGPVALFVLGGSVTVLAVVGALVSPGPRRQLAVTSVLLSALVYGATTRFMDVNDLVDAMGRPSIGLFGRYAVVSILVLLPAVAAGWESWVLRRRISGAANWAGAAVAAVYIIGVLLAYGQPTYQNTAATWTDAAAAVSAGCASGQGEFGVAVEPIGWAIIFPCSAVAGR